MRSRTAFPLLLWACLAARPAAASDGCLEGASLLTDQRGLAALRTATEGACPCSLASSRGIYQRCAKGQLATAIGSGELRSQCKKAATRVNRGATCGSSTVACGRFKAAAKTPLGCVLRPPAKCGDRPGIEEAACAAETHCADVIDWTAGTCVDARENGPYAAGVRLRTLSKPSAVNPAQDRVLETVVWYPAEPGSGPLSPSYKAVIDAPFAASGGPFPLLMFSHGSCGYPAQSTFLTALLASHGFIVAAPPHPGNTILEFPNCSSSAAVAAAVVERPADVLFTLDQMLAASADAGSPIFAQVDETRIGMAGHSFGGFTTYLAVAGDPRFKVAVPLAPAVPGAPMLSIPSLSMIGEVDSLVNNQAVRDTYARAQAPKYLIEILNTGHYAFSNGCFPGPDCNPPVTLTQTEANQVVLRWVLPFLELHLKGDQTFAQFLASPPPPGVLFDSQL
jgi:dienelactone hydrolase